MPWKKNFDLDEASTQAMCVFWKKGYEATSLTDLTEAMQINKGSLYNAFHNKKSLFTRVLLQYDKDTRQKLLTELEALDNPVKAIRSFFEFQLANFCSDVECKGCLMTNTAQELPLHSEDNEIREIVSKAFNELEQFFSKQIELGQKAGDISSSISPQTASQALLAQVIGFNIMIRGYADAERLQNFPDQAMAIIGK